MKSVKNCTICKIDKPLSEYRIQSVVRSNGKKSVWTLGKCRQCERDYLNARNANNRDRQNAEGKRSYAKNKDSVLRRSAEYYANNKDIYAIWRKDNARSNPEREKAKKDEWRKRNLSKDSARAMRRYALKALRIPTWIDDNAVNDVYLKASELTKQSGVRHEVDHIIPLNGKLVSGLHVDNNLQILTKSENCKKSNKYAIG